MRQATHEIWDSRFLSQIIEAMGDGVFTLDRQGRITSWNPSMERISGFTAEEAMGQSCSILGCSRCFGRDCPADLEACGILEHGGAENSECLLQHKSGQDVPVIKNARAVRDEQGQIIGVVETVTDLSELHRARRRAEDAARRLGEVHRLDNIIGKSHAMQDVFQAIEAAAASDATVLIRGDSGTGKELVAGAIHYNSLRAKKPLVTVNCAALSESLLESELFGHVRGAFTGALRDRPGRFEEATGGTVFLDEIGELSPYIQVKLLRVIQEREIERVGESRRRPVDIRLIAATHRDLYSSVRSGGFREDLYYRLKVFPIALPRLQQRREDIPLLVSHFISRLNPRTGKRIEGLSQAALRALLDYPWPGNVRELENAIEHAFVLCRGGQIELHDLPVEIRQNNFRSAAAPGDGPGESSAPVRQRPSREQLQRLLDECDWNKAEVARRIGVSRTAVWKYLKKYGIGLQRPD
jgi:PAS domain S-box-containing protein